MCARSETRSAQATKAESRAVCVRLMVAPLNYSKEPVLLMLLEMRHITFWLLLLKADFDVRAPL